MEYALYALWFLVGVLNIVLFVYLSERYKTPSYLFAALSTYIVLANIISFKLINITSYFIVPAGILVYSLTFLISDYLSEIYGKNIARQAVISGLVMNLAVLAIIYLTNIFPSPSFAQQSHELFSQAFSLTGRIILGSLTAYIISQNISVYLYHLLKTKTKSKYMWLRNNTSTWTAQLFDTVIFITIAFYGTVPNNVLVNMILSQYFIKVIIALFDTPFLYLSVYVRNKTRK